MKQFPIIVRIGGLDKDARRGFRTIKGRGHKVGDDVFSGLSSTDIYKDGRKKFTVWINSRQNDREFVDTFFHEMTHVLCRLLDFRTCNEETLCRWIGYLAKSQFADARPSRFGRRKERIR